MVWHRCWDRCDISVIMVKFDRDRVGRKATAESQYWRSWQDVQLVVRRGSRSLEAKQTKFPPSLYSPQRARKDTGQSRLSGRPGSLYARSELSFHTHVNNLNSLFRLGFAPTAIRVNPAVQKEMACHCLVNLFLSMCLLGPFQRCEGRWDSKKYWRILLCSNFPETAARRWF